MIDFKMAWTEKFYRYLDTIDEKSWKNINFCPSYSQRKMGTFLWPTLYINKLKTCFTRWELETSERKQCTKSIVLVVQIQTI